MCKKSINNIEDEKMKKVMKIDGMMCSHCTGTVTKVLNAIDLSKRFKKSLTNFKQ